MKRIGLALLSMTSCVHHTVATPTRGILTVLKAPLTIAAGETAAVTWESSVAGDFVVAVAAGFVVARDHVSEGAQVTTQIPASAFALGPNDCRILVFAGAEPPSVATFTVTLAGPTTLSWSGTAVFPTQNVGTQATTTLTLTNTGATSATFSSVDSRSFALASPFSVAGGTCFGTTSLAAGATCTLIIIYAPRVSGTDQATLDFTYEDGVGSAHATVALSGTASSVCTGVAASASDYTLIGAGSVASPYVLCTIAQLTHMSSVPSALGSSFALGQNLDIGGAHLGIIGNDTTPFTGTFDGRDFSISNFVIQNGTYNTGLFGTVASTAAEIRNLHLINGAVTGTNGSKSTGILAGNVDRATVLNCSSSGTATGVDNVGGLVGYATNDAVISTSSSAATVSSQAGGGAGGLIGFCNCAIANSFATGAASGGAGIGGLVGNANGADVINAYALGNVIAATGAGGGLMGSAGATYVFQSFAIGNVTSGSASSDGASNGPSGHFVGVQSSAQIVSSAFYAGASCTITSTSAPSAACQDAGTLNADPTLSDFYAPENLFPPSLTLPGQPIWDMANTWVAQPGDFPTLAPTLFDYASWGDCSTNSTAANAGGRGTPEAPYLICTPEQLIKAALTPGYLYGTFFRLMSDLDLSPYANAEAVGFPWGASSGLNSAAIIFDGNGKTIAHFALTETSGAQAIAFVSNLQGAVKRLGFTGATVSSNGISVAVISASDNANYSQGAIIDCYVDATSSVSSTCSAPSGVAGLSNAGTVSNSYSAATLSGGANTSVAGVTANIFTGVANCFSASPITGGGNSGQIQGANGACNAYTPPTNSYYLASATCAGCCSPALYPTAEPQSFFQNDSTGTLFGTWDFAHVWQANAGGYPTLR